MSRSLRAASSLGLCFVAVIVAASAGLPASARAVQPPNCPPGIGIGLVDYPAGTQDPRAQEYVVDHVRPGVQFSRRFQVCNGTAAPVTVALYAGAAVISDGSFQILEGRRGNELSSWISVAPSRLTVAPQQRELARATFRVPADAVSGERYGVLLAELPSQPDPAGILVASRVGIRVYLDVGPGGAPPSDFTIDALQAGRTAAGVAQVRARVRNTGRRALDIAGSLRLSNGPAGLSGGPYPARLGTTLAPGQTEPVVVPIGSIAAGPWTSRLTLRSGLLQRQVQATLTFPGPGQFAPPVQPKPVSSGLRPPSRRVLLIVALALLMLAGVMVLREWRLRRW